MARIAVYSQERPDLKVTKVTSSKPGLIVAEAKPMTAEEAKQLKIEKGYLVFVELKPGMPLGNFHEELVVHTDHPKQPEVKVSVGGKHVRPDQRDPRAAADARRHEPGGGLQGPDADRPRRHGDAFQGGAEAREAERGHRRGTTRSRHEGPISDDRHRAARHGRRQMWATSCSRPTTPRPAR